MVAYLEGLLVVSELEGVVKQYRKIIKSHRCYIGASVIFVSPPQCSISNFWLCNSLK